MNVRQLAAHLQDLSRRGYGDKVVHLEVGGDGAIHRGILKKIEAEPSVLVLSGEG
jgi:hypothetical protein